MNNLAKVCEGFVYAGFTVSIVETYVAVACGDNICAVCNHECEGRSHIITLYNRARTIQWSFARIHTYCTPWTDSEWSQWITRPHDPLSPYKGFTMVCRAFADMNFMVCIRKPARSQVFTCLICQDNSKDMDIEFAISDRFICGQVHKKCIESFEKERDLAIDAYMKARAWKIWALPLISDCRVIIGRFLVQLSYYKEVFNAMYGGR